MKSPPAWALAPFLSLFSACPSGGGAPTPPDPAPSSAASAGPARLAPTSGEWLQHLVDARGELVADFSPPLGATEKRPLVVALHGGGDAPEYACGEWRGSFGPWPFILCPYGAKMGKGLYAWGSGGAARKAVERAVEALAEKYPEHLDLRDPVLTGFSLGAMVAPAAIAAPGRAFPAAVLVEGYAKDFEAWPKRLQDRGLGRILFVDSQGTNAERGKAAVRSLERTTGVQARAIYVGHLGHGFFPKTVEGVRKGLSELLSGLPGWASYPYPPVEPQLGARRPPARCAQGPARCIRRGIFRPVRQNARSVGPNQRTVRLLSLGFFTACGVACGLQIWISMLSHGHALWRVVLYQVLIWNMWFVFTPFIGRLARRHSLVPPTRRAVFVHALLALALGPVHSAWWAMLLVTMRPYDAMGTSNFAHAYYGIAGSSLPLQLMVYCGVLAAHYAGDYYAKFREREVEAARLEASLSEARLYALELQIRPHFLFNTLNSISALARASRNGEAVAMIAGLSDLLRYTLDHAGEQRVPLEDEVRITRRYLEIERVRFPDRMSFSIDVAPDARRAAVPTLILQPLAENAVRHGIAQRASAGRVEIRAFCDGGDLRIEVFNTGALAPGHRPGVGLRNTTDRLRHLYRGAHSFDLCEARGGVLASISLPFGGPA